MWPRAASATISAPRTTAARTGIAADPNRRGARVGITSGLLFDTTGQALTHHTHDHMIVPGGGLSSDGTRWVACKPGLFLHVRVLSRLFQRLFIEGLLALLLARELSLYGDLNGLSVPQTFAAYLVPLRKIKWVVYAKPPLGGPEQALAYLSRYTHPTTLS